MATYISQPYLDEIERKKKLLKDLKSKARREPNAYEYEKLLASYYLIEVCSGLEHAAKNVISQLISTSSSHTSLKSYLLNSRYITSAECEKIEDFLSKLNGRAKKMFKSKLRTIEKDAIKSLYYNRQRIVHYSESKMVHITFGDVELWHKNSIRVIKKFETVLKKYV